MATDEIPIAEPAEHEPVKRPAPEKPRKRRRWLRVLITVVVVLVVIAVALAALFAWDRWYRFDDAADIQGTWYPAGSTTAVEIGPDAITFNAETAYSYTLDTHEKTVTYALGNLQGTGHYWFANDRSALVIEDCDDADLAARNLMLEDLGRLFANLGAAITGAEPALPEGDCYSAFTREPDPAAVAAKEEAARQAIIAETAARQAAEDASRAEAAAAEAEAEAEAEAGADTETDTDADVESESESESESADEQKSEPKSEPKDFANESMGIQL